MLKLHNGENDMFPLSNYRHHPMPISSSSGVRAKGCRFDIESVHRTELEKETKSLLNSEEIAETIDFKRTSGVARDLWPHRNFFGGLLCSGGGAMRCDLRYVSNLDKYEVLKKTLLSC